MTPDERGTGAAAARLDPRRHGGVDKIGTRIGTVARVEGGHLKIVRPEQESRNEHQFVSPDLIHSVDERVTLTRSWDELRRLWSQSEFAEQQHQHRPV